ncbi:MAG: hypothetical protein P8074_21570 [Anaerolineales bacterium]
MKTRPLSILTSAVTITTAVWVALTIYRQATLPPINTLADQIAFIEGQFGLFKLNYINAALITLANAALFAGLYVYCRDESPIWAAVGLVFVPMYAFGNLVVYLSQVFVVPELLALYHDPANSIVAQNFLAMTLQEWSGAAAEFVNLLSYALLGISSIVMGLLLKRKAAGLRAGSLLLAISGVLSILSLVGLGTGSALLASMVMVSGLIFLVAVVLLAAYFLHAYHPSRTAGITGAA